jgi:hypothetical protein
MAASIAASPSRALISRNRCASTADLRTKPPFAGARYSLCEYVGLRGWGQGRLHNRQLAGGVSFRGVENISKPPPAAPNKKIGRGPALCLRSHSHTLGSRFRPNGIAISRIPADCRKAKSLHTLIGNRAMCRKRTG